MNVKGPGGPGGPAEVPELPEASEADKLDGSGVVQTATVDRSAPVLAPSGAAPDPIAQLAQGIKTGQVSPGEALGRLLDLVGDKVPAAVRARVRAELEATLKEDPYLAGKAKRLGIGE